MPVVQRPHTSLIEPLEARIAPALLVNGANLLGGGGPLSGETSVGGNSVTLVKVLSGQALVWFDGFDITSISVGPGTRLDITGNVEGDIIANLEADGTLSDSDGDATNGEDGGQLLPNDILGIKTRPLSGQRGSIGNIITGGSVSNVDISGVLHGVYAGDGVFRSESFIGSSLTVQSFVGIDINPVAPGLQALFVLEQADATMRPGASVNGVTVKEAFELQVFAGNGSPTGAVATANGANGGSITNIKIEAAVIGQNSPNPSYHLIAGDGQDGRKGGAGGSIISVIEAKSTGDVFITAGNGGVGSAAAGGAGGSVVSLDLQSAGSNYVVIGGDGGAGTPGGAGGKMVNNNFANRTPSTGVIIAADFNGDGFDDVIVIDPGTGDMVLSANVAGANFQQVGQGNATVIIDGAATTPVDGLATDMDDDGDVDVVVLYQDGTLATFLNDGTGDFYDPNLNGGVGGFQVLTMSLGYEPAKFSLIAPDSSTFVIAENTEGKGTLHLISMSAVGGTLTTFVPADVRKFGLPIVDVVGHFAALSDGTIARFEFSLAEENAFASVQTLPIALTGGLVDLDLDSTQRYLVALSASNRAVAVYDVNTTGAAPIVFTLAGVSGRPLAVKFLHDDDAATQDDIVILSAVNEGAQFTRFIAVDDGDPLTPATYTQSGQFDTTTQLKNFVGVYTEGSNDYDIAALSGTLNSFFAVRDLASEDAYPLPFASKQVTVIAGNGGFGEDTAKVGKGGAGGSINGINVDAQTITLIAGNGGDSTKGKAGAGGSVSNFVGPLGGIAANAANPTAANAFKTAGGAVVTPKLVADVSIAITAGLGGSPTGAVAKSAAGGAGGDLSSLSITLTEGDITLSAGNGGTGNGGAGGAGGSVRAVRTLASGNLDVSGGIGGSALGPDSGNGGAGGNVVNLRHELALDSDQEKVETTYSVLIVAGSAGSSLGATGGAGGDLVGINLLLDGADRTYERLTANPPLQDAQLDSTITVTAIAGAAGDGKKAGGAGGDIIDFVSESVYDQSVSGGVFVNYVVLGMIAGQGGDASSGNGGVGGSIRLSKPISGITFHDPHSPIFDPGSVEYDPTRPSLLAVGGSGGDGSAKGGVGGGVSGLLVQNSAFVDGSHIVGNHLESAVVLGGAGGAGGTGAGGAGGAVKNSLLGVRARLDVVSNDPSQAEFLGGFLEVQGGAGGFSGSNRGGAGGAVTNSEFGLVQSFYSLGMSVSGGLGGTGASGGDGGALSALRINTPQSTLNLSAILRAGDGGTGTTASGVGGKGGDVSGVAQAKDFNSSINLVQAGNGGDNGVGRGGAGGNILNFKTVGFIGRPSDSSGTQLGVFDSYLVDHDNDPFTPAVPQEIAQGIFSGRGGDGTTNGLAGSINGVAARQIAAMSAAVDLSTGLFAAATRISNVKAALIGFDADMDGNCDDENNDPIVPPASPATVKPTDGFLMATTIANVIITGQARTNFVFDV